MAALAGLLLAGLPLAAAAQARTAVPMEIVVPAGPTLRLADGRELRADVVGIEQRRVRLRRPDGAEETVPSGAIAELRFATVAGGTITGRLIAWQDGIYELQASDGPVRVFATFRPSAPTPPAPSLAQPASEAPPSPSPAPQPAPAAAAIDPTLPAIEVSVAPASEGSGVAAIELTLSAPAAQAVAVIYATIDGTAKAGADYVTQRGVLVIEPGSTAGAIRVPLVDDELAEEDEELELFVSVDPKRARLASRQVVARIKDDDTARTQ